MACAACGRVLRAPRRRLPLPDGRRAAAAGAVPAPVPHRARARRLSPPVAADYYRRAAVVPRDDPHAAEWRIRRESYHHLQRHVLPAVGAADARARSRRRQRLAVAPPGRARPSRRRRRPPRRRGGRPWRVPPLSDAVSRPCRPTSTRCRSSRGSSISSSSTARCTTRPTRRRRWPSAQRMLAPGGALAVMDSPMFSRDRDGAGDGRRDSCAASRSSTASPRSCGPASAF